MMPLLRLTVRALALMLALIPTANAYVDPGTGAMVIQMIGAAFAGALFYLRNLRRHIASWFARGRRMAPRQGAPGND